MMIAKIVFALAAIALVSSMPSDNSEYEVAIHQEAVATIELLQAQGTSNNACADLADSTINEVTNSVADSQKVLDALDTGANCPAKGKAEVEAAQAALSASNAAVAAAGQAVANAQNVQVKFKSQKFGDINPNNCQSLYGPNTDYANKKAAFDSAQAQVASSKAAQSSATQALSLATTAAAKLSKECRCRVKGDEEKAWAAASAGPHIAANDKAFKKAKQMKCVIAGNANCNTGVTPTVTRPKLAPGVAETTCVKPTPAPTAAPPKAANQAPTGVNNWVTCVKGTNYGGINKVCGQEWTQHGDYYKITWPIVKLEGTNIQSGQTISLHAGCGNTNGQDGCDSLCKSIGSAGKRDGWDVPCGKGYPAGVLKVAARCYYKQGPVSSNKDDWKDMGASYNPSDKCYNPMNWCSCKGKLP